MIRLVDGARVPTFGSDESAALEHVIRTTKELTFQKFINLVYSTYPIATQPRYRDLDLVELASDYSKRLARL